MTDKFKLESTETLYNFLNSRLPKSLNYNDLNNLYYSLFCTLEILPENLKSLKLTKEVLARTFVKLSTEKNIIKLTNQYRSELIPIKDIQDEKYWIEQIAISMRTDNWPNYEKARILIGTE